MSNANTLKSEGRARQGIPISRAVSVFIGLLMTVFAGAVLLLVHVSVDRFIDNGLDDFMTRDMLAIRESAMSFLDYRIKILHDHARHPQLIQGLTRGGIEGAMEFMNGFSLLGEQYQTCLLDSRGKTIHMTKPEPKFEYENEEWVGKIMNGKFERYMGISRIENKFFWRLVTPVVDVHSPIGFFVVEIPLEAIDADNNFSLILTGSQVRFLVDGEAIASFGSEIDGEWETFNLPGVGASMNYRADRSSFIKMYKEFIGKLTICFLLLAGLTIAAAITFGKRFFALPLMKMRALSSALAQGATVVNLPANHKIREMRLLARDFGIMASKIIERERFSKDAREVLEENFQERTKKLMAEIADRKKAEHALRKSEQRMQLALKSANLGFWDWDIRTGEFFIDHRWAEMLGYSPDEIGAHIDSWKKLIHPDDTSELMEVLSAHLEGKLPFYVSEHRAKTSSGEWKWILARGKVVERDENGKPVRATGTHMDISNRKRMEEEMLRIKKAVDCASEAIAIAKTGWIYFYQNRAFTRLFGFRAEELKGPEGFLPLFADRNVGREIHENIMNGGSWEGEVDVKNSNGGIMSVSLRTDPIRGEMDEIIGLVCVYSEIEAVGRFREPKVA